MDIACQQDACYMKDGQKKCQIGEQLMGLFPEFVVIIRVASVVVIFTVSFIVVVIRSLMVDCCTALALADSQASKRACVCLDSVESKAAADVGQQAQ